MERGGAVFLGDGGGGGVWGAGWRAPWKVIAGHVERAGGEGTGVLGEEDPVDGAPAERVRAESDGGLEPAVFGEGEPVGGRGAVDGAGAGGGDGRVAGGGFEAIAAVADDERGDAFDGAGGGDFIAGDDELARGGEGETVPLDGDAAGKVGEEAAFGRGAEGERADGGTAVGSGFDEGGGGEGWEVDKAVDLLVGVVAESGGIGGAGWADVAETFEDAGLFFADVEDVDGDEGEATGAEVEREGIGGEDLGDPFETDADAVSGVADGGVGDGDEGGG